MAEHQVLGYFRKMWPVNWVPLPVDLLSARAAAVLWIKANPGHFAIELFLVGFVAYIMLVKRAYDPAKKGYGGRSVPALTEKEKEELLAEWEPEPLVKSSAADKQANDNALHYVIEKFVDGPEGVRVKIEGREAPCIAFTSQDFLGFGSEPTVRKTAEETLERYTVGSCGPRGFYGTTLAHLELEESIARFMGTPESITYSDSTATIASAIPAFAKRGDVLLIDSGANFGIQLGASLSRCKIVYWEHNNIEDLQRKLEAVADSDARKTDLSMQQRRFIVVEGLYANTGHLCPLRQVQRLAAKYRWRIMLDDSLGFGVLGPSGRGITDHEELATTDVDVMVGSLATTLGSVGGFCTGSREVVGHQRLSGAGYCFSASSPPFLCATASASLAELQAHPQKLEQLKAKCRVLQELLEAKLPVCTVVSHVESPLKVLLLSKGPLSRARSSVDAASGPASRMLSPSTQKLAPHEERLADARLQEERVLDKLIVTCAHRGVLISRTHTLPNEAHPAWPGLKVYVTIRHTHEHMQALVETIRAVAEEMELAV